MTIWLKESQLIGKYSDAEEDWGQEDKGMTEDEMVGWHHRLSGHEYEWTLGDNEEQGSLTSCSSWGHKDLNPSDQTTIISCRYNKRKENYPCDGNFQDLIS